ncbi:MAG: ThuA domain-containing protein [Phycisphaerae bacterium]|nr:ThuA domain-containing protein [Phycisphaerae bacterium]
MGNVRVTVWNECWHEHNTEIVPKIYPDGIHGAIAAALREEGGLEVRTATLRDPECGLSDAVLTATDVLVWWGHMRHHEVPDDKVERVVGRVWEGMGFVGLHSAHYSKPFQRLMGTQCGLKWRVDNKKEILWVVDPTHPIAAGINEKIELPQTEMYGEWFQIPAPDELVFIPWFEGGEVFRSGCCWKRGKGRVFYFRPGHETLPIYHHSDVRRVLRNAVRWAASR